MKYYKITGQSDPKVIGVNNGIYQCEIIPEKFSNILDYRKVESTFAVGNYRDDENKYMPNDFKFEHVRLLKKAKITDIIGYCPDWIGFEFILSLKAKQLMIGLNLTNCSFFPVHLYDYQDNRVDETFHMLRASSHKISTLDFEECVFYTGSMLRGKKYHQIGSYEEFLAERERHPLLMAEQIALKQETADPDFIRTPFGGPFISETLLDRWKTFGVSGFKVINDQILKVL